jgi:hypothetical protein
VKRGWRVASILGLGILLMGLTAQIFANGLHDGGARRLLVEQHGDASVR